MTSLRVKNINYFISYFNLIGEKLKSISFDQLDQVAELICSAHNKGAKIIFVGNGGSAAMASHLSVDLTKAAKIRAINFNEADLLTCFANDYGYEHWAERALEAYADVNDVVVLISSSGKSRNIINAATYARKLNLPVITLSGFDGDNDLRTMGDLNLWCDSNEYNIVEMTHHVWLLAVVDYLIQTRIDKS